MTTIAAYAQDELSNRFTVQRWADEAMVAVETSRAALECEPDHSVLFVHPFLPQYVSVAVSTCIYAIHCATHGTWAPPVSSFLVLVNTLILLMCWTSFAFGGLCDRPREAMLRHEWRRYRAWKRLLLSVQHASTIRAAFANPQHDAALRAVLEHVARTTRCKSIFDAEVVAVVSNYKASAIAFRVARIW